MVTITPLIDNITLTPKKRHAQLPQAEFDTRTASLNFKEFSFYNEDGRLSTTSLSRQQYQALLSYLGECYGVTAMKVSLPYLILECEQEISPDNQLPLSVAGAISIWVKPDCFRLYNTFVGERGHGPRITLSEDLATDLTQMKAHKQETLLALAQAHFPDATAISYIGGSIIVELPWVDDELFKAHLEELPEAFTNANVNLAFRNGNPTHEPSGEDQSSETVGLERTESHRGDTDTNWEEWMDRWYYALCRSSIPEPSGFASLFRRLLEAGRDVVQTAEKRA